MFKNIIMFNMKYNCQKGRNPEETFWSSYVCTQKEFRWSKEDKVYYLSLIVTSSEDDKSDVSFRVFRLQSLILQMLML